MAQRDFYYPKFDESSLRKLTEVEWLVDINLVTNELYQSAIDLGFNPELWENNNKCRVLVDGVHYKER